MTKQINIQIDQNLLDEIAISSENRIIHSDFLLNSEDSQTEYPVEDFLAALPEDLQKLAKNKNKYGFYIVFERNLMPLIAEDITSGFNCLEDFDFENLFQKHLAPSYEKHFKNLVVNLDENGIYDYKNTNSCFEIVTKINSFAEKYFLENSKITINDEKIVVFSDDNDNDVNEIIEKYSPKLIYTNLVDLYVENN